MSFTRNCQLQKHPMGQKPTFQGHLCVCLLQVGDPSATFFRRPCLERCPAPPKKVFLSLSKFCQHSLKTPCLTTLCCVHTEEGPSEITWTPHTNVEGTLPSGFGVYSSLIGRQLWQLLYAI